MPTLSSVRLLAAALLAVAGMTVVVSAGSAGAATIDVGPTEEDLRQALVDATDATNTLNLTAGTEYVLDDCAEGDLDYSAGGDLTIVGNGATIRQTCDAERVIDYEIVDGTLRLEGLTLTGGEAPGDNGGGAFSGAGGASVELVNVTVTGNSAEFGGGVSFVNISATDSTISDNEASSQGGGLFVGSSNSVVTLVRTTVSGNSATEFGGGIDGGGTNVLINSTVSNNTAGSGSGGGIFNGSGGASYTFVYSTIVQNTAADGANLYNGGGGFVFNTFGSVFALPEGSDSCQLNTATPSSAGYNFDDATSCELGSGPGDITDGGDPLLAALAANGGPTPTRLPATDSPLVEQIPAEACDGPDGDITTDQRGEPRPGFDLCDIGSVELQSAPPTPEPIVINPTFTG